MRTAIDTNVLSALLSGVPEAPSIASLLTLASSEGALVISGVVYAELCAHPSCSNLDSILADLSVDVRFTTTEPVWRLAAAAFSSYAKRRRESTGGHPKRFLADFLVGAHAELEADRLLTLDAARYRTAFPKVRLIP